MKHTSPDFTWNNADGGIPLKIQHIEKTKINIPMQNKSNKNKIVSKDFINLKKDYANVICELNKLKLHAMLLEEKTEVSISQLRQSVACISNKYLENRYELNKRKNAIKHDKITWNAIKNRLKIYAYDNVIKKFLGQPID